MRRSLESTSDKGKTAKVGIRAGGVLRPRGSYGIQEPEWYCAVRAALIERLTKEVLAVASAWRYPEHLRYEGIRRGQSCRHERHDGTRSRTLTNLLNQYKPYGSLTSDVTAIACVGHWARFCGFTLRRPFVKMDACLNWT